MTIGADMILPWLLMLGDLNSDSEILRQDIVYSVFGRANKFWRPGSKSYQRQYTAKSGFL